ncbi:DUF2029 domain-containing protein [Rhodococcus rhodnii]|nr:glycosyltransferase 87 family protein [Rhodococcus rhodnii]TXG92881.1 DUF2029 domain-containing protein [Rhodococcus rhodnii]
MDLSVFQDAGRAFREGLPLYSADFPSTSGFRFIYPPFAAVLFAPLASIGATVLQVGWTVLNIVLVWWIVRTVLRALNVPRATVVAIAVAGVALLLEPVRSNFAFGQINIVLVALVVADCLGVLPRRLRGVGVGLAAAIKLTPAAFGLIFLLRRDYRSVGRVVGTFAATIALGFALLPQASLWFWTTEFFLSDRAGNHEFVRNQAVTGMLARVGVDGVVADAVWLLAAAVVVAAAWWAALRFVRAGEQVAAVGVVSLAVLLGAPFAVTHHWVWCILLVPLAIAPAYRSWRPLLASAALVFWIAPYIAFVEEPNGWIDAATRQLIGNAQGLVGLVLLAAAVVAASNRPARAGAVPAVPEDATSREEASPPAVPAS